MSGRAKLGVDDYVAGITGGDRTILGRALTLVESQRADDRTLAAKVLGALGARLGSAARVGVSGVPGVGKSTLIEALGTQLTARGHSVAVLAVDPSSTLSGGSILGDKTRMTRLSNDPKAFVRPSPTALTLGGVARRTRESMVVCEAAGYDVVLVETVGVGQSETAVANMVDCFVVLMLPGAGDELQGIKRGILELADLVVVNKADGDNLPRAREAAREYSAALRYWPQKRRAWRPRVLTASALTGEGLDALWAAVEEHRRSLEEAGELDALRREQRRNWMWSAIEDELLGSFKAHPDVAARVAALEEAVAAGETSPGQAAEELLRLYRGT